jgi:hypothetical protein
VRPSGVTDLLHIRCGSDLRDSLKAAGIEGDFLEYADPVCRGSTPATDDPHLFRQARLDYLVDELGEDAGETKTKLDAAEAGLAGAESYERIVLWFEHDIYDQAVLIRLLDHFEQRPELHDRLRMITLDRFPGVARFNGLGQLSPDQLSTLWGSETLVTPAQRQLGVAAWRAFRSGDPTELGKMAERDDLALPYLAPALRRHLQDLPWTRDGLSLTQRLTLQAMSEGALTPGKCFGALVNQLEPQPFLGDIMYWPIVAELARASEPAITPVETWQSPVALTPLGKRLLGGEADWLTQNGIKRHHGGLQLATPGAVWRWDDAAGVPRLL